MPRVLASGGLIVIAQGVVDQVREATDLVALVGATVELRQVGTEWRGRCPFHDDHHPSLTVNTAKQRFFCHPCDRHGDVFAWVMARDGIGFPDAARLLAKLVGIEIPGERVARPPRHAGITIAQWVSVKGLDAEVVRALGITDTIHRGAPAIAFPYFVTSSDAKPVAVHIRRTLEKRDDVPRFEWRQGDRTIPYLLWCLRPRERDFVVLVEGESDAITLLARNVPVVGIPGNRWLESWSHYLSGTDRIVVAVEPDDGGERLLESLESSSLWARCFLIPFSSIAATVAV